MIDTFKIRVMLEERQAKITSDLWDRLKPKDWAGDFENSLDEAWAAYLNGINCTALTEDEIKEDFEDIVNYSAPGRVCISMDDDETPYILFPVELAEIALALGGLPDSWFPENVGRGGFISRKAVSHGD